jgi:glycosyltransferase involved in cell wall biosynthesis
MRRDASTVLGRQLDSIAARGADAVLALSSHAARVLGASARGPVEAIPPGLETRRHPRPEAVAQVCARHALAAGRYVVYAGNLDVYQELPLLEAAAERLPEVVFAAVTHDPRGPALSRVRIATVADRAEARALVHGAAVAVLPRRIPGGFPVKLLNYMEAERPIVAFEEVAEGHVHGQSAWLLSAGAGPDELASAVRALLNDPARAQRLGREARTLLESRHAWPPLARRTLALAERAREHRHRGRG